MKPTKIVTPKAAAKAAAKEAERLAKEKRIQLDTAMWQAVRAGDSEKIFALAREGAPLYHKPSRLSATTLLGRAILSDRLESIDALIRLGFDPDKASEDTPSVLYTIWNQRAHLIPALIERGANVNAKDRRGNSALIIAAKCDFDKSQTVRILLECGADVNITDNEGKNPLYWAKKENRHEIVQLLRSAGAGKNPKSDLELEAMEAAKSGKAKQLEKLLREGVSANARDTIDQNRRTLLMIAAGAGKRDCVHVLLKAGAEIEAMDTGGCTALFHASEHGQTNTINALLDAGANAHHSIGKEKVTALELAFEWHHEKAAELILDQGLKWDLPAKRRTETLHAACGCGFIRIVDRLLRKGANPEERGLYGATPLHTAAGAGQLSVAQRLFEAGANVNAQNNKGATPLVEALMSAGPTVEIMSLREEDEPKSRREVSSTAMVQFLIVNGADVNLKDKDGIPPLYWVFTVADAKALLAAGADLRACAAACAREKKTLADLARERGNQRLAKFWGSHPTRKQ